MSIDWITVAAQIGNFLVLVWLLKRFLYRPILDGIDAREAEISRQMGEARRVQDMAEAEKAEFAQRRAALESEQASALDAVRTQAEVARRQLVAEAREQMSEKRVAAANERQTEARHFATLLQKSGSQALLTLMRKALEDLADQSLEEQIVMHAGQQIKACGSDLRAASTGGGVAVVVTQNSLSDAARKHLENQVTQTLPGVGVQFKTDAAQSPGLIMRIGGAQVSWTLDSYVESLSQMIEDQIAEKGHTQGAVDAAK
ncbi:F0F1 ATP synthase subunit B [Allopusillimonas ginsengisoli]|nr:F0F1 ATP synthase subunit B [Allopusillimonas ginsengisoli]